MAFRICPNAKMTDDYLVRMISKQGSRMSHTAPTPLRLNKTPDQAIKKVRKPKMDLWAEPQEASKKAKLQEICERMEDGGCTAKEGTWLWHGYTRLDAY